MKSSFSQDSLRTQNLSFFATAIIIVQKQQKYRQKTSTATNIICLNMLVLSQYPVVGFSSIL